MIYNKLIKLAGLLRYPQSPCFPPIMTLTTPRFYAPDSRFASADMGVGPVQFAGRRH